LLETLHHDAFRATERNTIWWALVASDVPVSLPRSVLLFGCFAVLQAASGFTAARRQQGVWWVWRQKLARIFDSSDKL
jgi:hypothetical protein